MIKEILDAHKRLQKTLGRQASPNEIAAVLSTSRGEIERFLQARPSAGNGEAKLDLETLAQHLDISIFKVRRIETAVQRNGTQVDIDRLVEELFVTPDVIAAELARRDALILSHEMMVRGIARRICNTRDCAYLKPDLVHVGMLKLTDLSEDYDHGLGTKFSTYCFPAVRGAMIEFYWDSLPVRVSRSHRERMSVVLRAHDYLMQKLQRKPALDEIAFFLSIPEEVVGEILAAQAEFIAQGLAATAEEIANRTDRALFTVKRVLRSQREVQRKKKTKGAATAREVAEHLAYTPERVGQILSWWNWEPEFEPVDPGPDPLERVELKEKVAEKRKDRKIQDEEKVKQGKRLNELFQRFGNELSDRGRTVAKLKLCGWSYTQIAKKQGLSLNTVKSLWRRAKQKLEEKGKNAWDEGKK